LVVPDTKYEIFRYLKNIKNIKDLFHIVTQSGVLHRERPLKSGAPRSSPIGTQSSVPRGTLNGGFKTLKTLLTSLYSHEKG
jgi:hypothetical protein